MVLLCGAAVLGAQASYWQWVAGAGSIGDDSSKSIAIDSQGNQYVTGSFPQTATFGSHSLTSSGLWDIFVAKIDPNGNWLWAVKAGGTEGEEGRGIAVDGEGNAYVTGMFYGTATFGTYSITSSGSQDIFAAKLDPDGNWLWAVKAGGADTDYGQGIAVDGTGNAYVTGTFTNSATFGSLSLTARLWQDIFVARLSPSGNWLWAVRAGGSGSDYGQSIALDGVGNAYVTGMFCNTAHFGSHSLISSGEEDIFAAKLNSSGNWLWAAKAGGTAIDRGYGIDVDGAGSTWVTGSFRGTATFGSNTLTSSGEEDIFAAKLDPSGNWFRAARAGGTSGDFGYGIAVDGTGNAWVTGSFRGTATFGIHTLISSGEEDIFAAKLSSSGIWFWPIKAGGTSDDFGHGIAMYGAGNTYVTGRFNETATFGSHTLTARAYSDIFVAKLSPIDEDAPPKAPENVQITLSGNSAVITWDAVTENILDQPITPSGYYIYKSTDPLGGFTYQGSSSVNQYILPTTAISHPRMFYHVTAFKQYVKGGFDPAAPRTDSGSSQE